MGRQDKHPQATIFPTASLANWKIIEIFIYKMQSGTGFPFELTEFGIGTQTVAEEITSVTDHWPSRESTLSITPLQKYISFVGLSFNQ